MLYSIGVLIECNGAASIYSQLPEGLSAMAYVHSAIGETYWDVMVLHISIVNWQEGSSAMGICAFFFR